MRSCGAHWSPSPKPDRRACFFCRDALGTVSLGLGNPPRCRIMGVKLFCARSAVSQHTVLGYCTPQHRPTPVCAPTG
jgi:hypothetical protein